MTPFFVQIPQTFNATRYCGRVLLPSALFLCEHIVPGFARKAPSTQLISHPTLTSFIFLDLCFSVASLFLELGESWLLAIPRSRRLIRIGLSRIAYQVLVCSQQ